MTFPENLKRIRKSKQLSQEALAELLDVSRQSVSKWEQGICMPEAQMLLRLSETLNVSLDALMSEPFEAVQPREPKAPRRRKWLWILCGCVVFLSIIMILSASGSTVESPETEAPHVTEAASPVFTTEEDWDELSTLSADFAYAYFAQDVDAVASFLAPDFVGDPKDVSPWSGIDTFFVKGVDSISSEKDDGMKIISIEFRNPDYPDSLSYLTVEFIKQNETWKIHSYYMEG